jgi:hypothetical protein
MSKSKSPKVQANPSGDRPSKESPNERSRADKGGKAVKDPHPDTEEGYGRDSKVPMTGLSGTR